MLLKNFFMQASQNELLDKLAHKYGYKLGAQTFVAGESIDELMVSIKKLNDAGISATVDNLGEFVYEKEEAREAKEQILQVIETIHVKNLDAHISIKPTQLGLDIDFDFCLENMLELVGRANAYHMFVNVDMEDYKHLSESLELVNGLLEKYDNVGTVIQSYLFQAKDDVQTYQNERLRIVKGAYKESSEVAYQNKEDIDRNFIELVEHHLLHGKFTSIATHDHHIINHVIDFVKANNIPNDSFEFQMLYGFRNDLQQELADAGYHFCTYVPCGKDWYGYFMRRLAERPQNINLVVKKVFNKKTNTIIGVTAGILLLATLAKRTKK